MGRCDEMLPWHRTFDLFGTYEIPGREQTYTLDHGGTRYYLAIDSWHEPKVRAELGVINELDLDTVTTRCFEARSGSNFPLADTSDEIFNWAFDFLTTDLEKIARVLSDE